MTRLGGKGQGLVNLLENEDLKFKVPEFSIIDTSYHEEFLRNENLAKFISILKYHAKQDSRTGIQLPERLKEKCKELTKRFKGRPVKVRSAAEKSEDSDHSGSGIYETLDLEKDFTQEQLEKAVSQVYFSLNSEQALEYRKRFNIEDEKMAVIVQEAIKPDFQGVMFTSNPTYPSDLSIEFAGGNNSVVRGKGASYIIDFDKKTKNPVFKSERYTQTPGVEYATMPILEELLRIGIALEKRSIPSDIEFVIRKGKIYLVQQRKITDLQIPEKLKVPKYERGRFIGKTKIKRGSGKVTLPVIKFADVGEITQKAHEISRFDKEGGINILKIVLNQLVDADKRYKDGYVLVTPHFHDTIMHNFSVFLPNQKITPTLDNLTPNKKAVITLLYPQISSHIMNISRERGIVYAGFDNRPDLDDKLRSGDIISMYFVGRECRIYKEESIPSSIRKDYPELSFKFNKHEKSMLSFETNMDIGEYKPYLDDFLFFLNSTTGRKWKFKTWEVTMGGYYSDKNKKDIVIEIARMTGKCHYITFPGKEWMKHCGYKSLPEEEFKKIMEDYRKHLEE